MYSVGYAGYVSHTCRRSSFLADLPVNIQYGLSLIAGSEAVLYVSLAAHACQFAFLVFFEEPRKSSAKSMYSICPDKGTRRHRANLRRTQAHRHANPSTINDQCASGS